MVNHALFAGLLHADATPITDDSFHNQALSLKLHRASQDPTIRKVQSDRIRTRQIKADLLALTGLTDSQLNLPLLNPELPLAELLKYRLEHGAALCQARDKLGWMARQIEAEPWSDAFAAELEHKTIPDVAKELDEVRRERDSWLKSKRGRMVLSASGIAVGAAAVVLSVFPTPLTPWALVTAGLSLVSGTVIPGVEWVSDWRDGKEKAHENGLHYLLRI